LGIINLHTSKKTFTAINLHYNYIIIGQGIAGTMLAWQLQQQKQRILIIDNFDSTTSSQVAAGIYLPITGRRIVKSWMSDVFIPFAEKTYRELEQLTGEQFLHPMPVLEIFDSQKTTNEWQLRAGTDDIGGFVKKFHTKNFSGQVQSDFGAIELQHTGYVNMSLFLKAMRSYFKQNQLLLEENFMMADMKVNEKISYKNISADKIIFCEGIAAAHNPYFSHLPYQFSKGEMITIHCNDLPEDKIINQGIFILPLGNHLFKVGSTYEWNNLNTDTTEGAKEKLKEQLQKILRIDFTIVDQIASIRPTVKERRPFIGLHPSYPSIGIFNGLGTKGIMLAPYLSQHFNEHLLNGESLMSEIDVQRFSFN